MCERNRTLSADVLGFGVADEKNLGDILELRPSSHP
jgi:hypothetical protein